jgi:hypothetical protein
MGTSRNYKASIKNQPQWGELSSTVTRSCDGDEITSEEAEKILSLYFQVTTGGNVNVDDIDNHKPPVPVDIPPPTSTSNGSGTHPTSSGSGSSNSSSATRDNTGKSRSRKNKSIGKAGRKTASKLGSFFSSVASSGLSQAFTEIGIDISGKTVRDAINYLLDYCSGAKQQT